MRIAVWSPLPPSPSGIADFVAESLPVFSQAADVVCVVPDPRKVDPCIRSAVEVVPPTDVKADLDVYHLGNSPPHGYVYRAALSRPGVAFLHELNLHNLVLSETVERGDPAMYVRVMRREHGEEGSFVARQVARGLGGTMLPAIFALREGVLQASLAVVGLGLQVCSAASEAIRPRPVHHLRHHLSLPEQVPSREEARHCLSLPTDAFIATLPGLATPHKGVEASIQAMARLREVCPQAILVFAGAEDPQVPLARWLETYGMNDACVRAGRLPMERFVAHLAASDVVLALRFPSLGEVSGALVRALGLGRAAIVSEGSAATDEFPDGCVLPVPPGPHQPSALLRALVRLAEDGAFRQRIGDAAGVWVRREHDLRSCTRDLVSFLERVQHLRPQLEAHVERPDDDSGLLDYLVHEARWHARDLGLTALPLRAWLADLAGEHLE